MTTTSLASGEELFPPPFGAADDPPTGGELDALSDPPEWFELPELFELALELLADALAGIPVSGPAPVVGPDVGGAPLLDGPAFGFAPAFGDGPAYGLEPAFCEAFVEGSGFDVGAEVRFDPAFGAARG